MSGAAGGAAAAAAAAAAIANAIKASGAIIKMKPDEFVKIVKRADKPAVVMATGGFFSPSYKYITSYKGLFFYTSSKEQLMFPGNAESILCDKIWIPG
jgi:hypothetical protein